jgi:hypothetical protein
MIERQQAVGKPSANSANGVSVTYCTECNFPNPTSMGIAVCRNCGGSLTPPDHDADDQRIDSAARSADSGASSHAHESATIGTSVWNPSNKTVVAIAMSLAALIVVGALALGWSPLRNEGSPTRPVGAVTSVELSQAFVTDPCAALERYHGRWFRITGSVLPADQWSRWSLSAIPLESGKHTGGGLSCQGKVLFEVQTVEEAVLLSRDVFDGEVSPTVDLVCRIHLAGWGFFDYSPAIWAKDCQAPD